MANLRNQKNERRLIRRKLERWGMDPKEIDLCLMQVANRQRDKNDGLILMDAPLCTRAEYVRLMKKNVQNPSEYKNASHMKIGDDYEAPDDKGYKPSAVDPLLKGAARATGATAKVVKRGKTVTKSQHEEMQ